MASSVLGATNPITHVVPKELFKITFKTFEISVSNHMFMIAVATMILLISLSKIIKPNTLLPKGFQNAIELICVYLRDETVRPILGKNTDKYIPFAWTMFFFILTLNLLGMIPADAIVHVVSGKKYHYGGSATANIFVTGALAMITFILTHAAGIKRYGILKYLAQLAPRVPWWIIWLIYPIEVMTAFIRPFTLAIRLFANVVAGHILLAALLGLMFIFKNWGVAVGSVLGDVLMSCMELLVAFIQAFVFTLLSILYISLAIEAEHV
jgi:F-type H+-transporting ATPase subunit a